MNVKNLKPKDIFYKISGPLKIYKCHVVAVLKNEPQPQIVFKLYGKHKQWWHYEILSIIELQMCFDMKRAAKTLKEIKE